MKTNLAKRWHPVGNWEWFHQGSGDKFVCSAVSDLTGIQLVVLALLLLAKAQQIL